MASSSERASVPARPSQFATGVRQQFGVVQPGQLDQVRAAGELARQPGRGAQQARKLGQLAAPPHECGDLDGQVTGPLPG